jgi:PhzF family phenazine biosynthesis protein
VPDEGSGRFHFVDVFAVEPLTRQFPLEVVEDAVDLTVDQLQRIAREFNQSETTFILPPTRPDADWRLRSFTAAGVEVFGAGGHNSLGAWWWRRRRQAESQRRPHRVPPGDR